MIFLMYSLVSKVKVSMDLIAANCASSRRDFAHVFPLATPCRPSVQLPRRLFVFAVS